MHYPKQTDNYDVDIFNQNFRELADESSKNKEDLQQEISRARVAEKINADAISVEIKRADRAEKANADAIKTETDRAKAVESLKAPIDSPVFTGTPQATTPDTNANDLRIATTAFVKAVINALVDGAPETLDTLKEIADAIAEHREVTDALNAAIGAKVDKVAGKGLSTNDYTTAEKSKLSGIAAGAEANVQPDWNVEDSSSGAYIKHKPAVPTKTSELINDSGFLTSGSAMAGVSGVKGSAETNYRTGNVNLTPANIGAVETSNVLTTAEQINANTDPANVAGATAVKEMVSQINSKLSDYLIYDIFFNNVQGPYQLTHKGGHAYSIDYSINVPDGRKLLLAYVNVAWVSSLEWADFFIANPFVYTPSGTINIYLKEAPSDMKLYVTLNMVCVLIPI